MSLYLPFYFGQAFWISNSTYIMSTTFMKLSLLFQYMRMYGRESRVYRLCIIISVVIGLWGTAFSIIAWLPCFPVYAYWDFDVTNRVCYAFGVTSDQTAFIAQTATNMLFDLIILALPIPLYFKMYTPKKTRIGMLVLLFFGLM